MSYEPRRWRIAVGGSNDFYDGWSVLVDGQAAIERQEMKLLMMLLGIIDKEDWYNSERLPWLQVLYIRCFKRKRGQVYGFKPWW